MRCFQVESLHLGICLVRLAIWPAPGLASCAARRLPQVWYDKAEELGACPWEGLGSSKGGRGSVVSVAEIFCFSVVFPFFLPQIL